MDSNARERLGILTATSDDKPIEIELISMGTVPFTVRVNNKLYQRIGEYKSTASDAEKYIDESETISAFICAKSENDKRFYIDLLSKSSGPNLNKILR